jgi:hypothetical protein
MCSCPTAFPAGSAAGSPEFGWRRRLPRPSDPIAQLCFFAGAPAQMFIFHRVSILQELVKCVENCSKIQKIAKPIFLDSWWNILQLLLFSQVLLLDIVNMKNRIVKYLYLP